MTKSIDFDPPDFMQNSQLKLSQPTTQEQRQQWLLTLEKAYLSLQGDKLNGGKQEPTDSKMNSGRKEMSPEDGPLPQDDFADAGRNEHPALDITDKGAPKHANLNVPLSASAPDEPVASPLLIDSSQRVPSKMSLKDGLKAPASTARFAGDQNILAQIPELRSATLLKSEQGLHLVMRDLQVSEIKQLVEKVRKVFSDLNLPLVRITINGKSAWSQGIEATSLLEKESRAAVNKVY